MPMSFTTLIVLAVDTLATSGDITMTWTSPMFSKLSSNDSSVNPLPRPITDQQGALIGSLINIGAMLGVVPFSFISESFGRKKALLAIGAFHVISYATMAFARRVWLFYFGRLFGGLAVGGGYTLLPMYIAEISEESKRGYHSMTLAVFWAFGNFLPYLVGPFVSVKSFNLINAAFPTCFLLVFSIIGTESPFYLVGAGRLDEAEKVLKTLRSSSGSIQVEDELKRIGASIENEKATPATLRNVITNPGIRKAFIIAFGLMAFQQLSGWNAITFYLQPIFDGSGINLPSYYSSMIVGASIFVFSLPSPYFAHKFGRKTLLVASTVSMGVCLAVLGAFFTFKDRLKADVSAASWVPVTFLVVLVLGFQNGMAGLPWTISAEIFPKNVKKWSASSTCAVTYFMAFLMTQFFDDMRKGLGTDGTFYFYAVFSFLCVVFAVFYVPETRGKTFVEIQEMLRR